MSMISININGPYHTGHVRWNGSSRTFEVMDQNGGWQQLYFNTHDMFPFAGEFNDLMMFVRQERERKARLKKLREQYPTLDQALTHAEVIEALVQDHLDDGIKPSLVP